MLYRKVAMEDELIFNKLGHQIAVRLDFDLKILYQLVHAGTGNRGDGRGSP